MSEFKFREDVAEKAMEMALRYAADNDVGQIELCEIATRIYRFLTGQPEYFKKKWFMSEDKEANDDAFHKMAARIMNDLRENM